MMARQRRRQRAASYVSSGSDDDEVPLAKPRKRGDDDDVILLNSPPAHMRRVSNEDNPIVLDDSDDDDDDDDDDDEERDLEDEAFFSPVPWDPNPTRKGKKKSNASGPPSEAAQTIAVGNKRKRQEKNDSGAADTNSAARPNQRVRLMSQFRANNDPVPGPSRPASVDDYVAQIIEILPDIWPDYARREIVTAAGPADTGVQRCVTKALEMEGGYPKAKPIASGSNSRQVDEPEHPAGYRSKVYRKEHRQGRPYSTKCIAALEAEFQDIPLGHIRLVLAEEKSMFAPAYIRLSKEQRETPKVYVPLKKGRRPAREPMSVSFADDLFTEGMQQSAPAIGAGEFEKEQAWTLRNTARILRELEEEEAARLADEAEVEAGGGIECGCCFADYLARNMYQCEEGHLFCKDCSTKHAETKLGDQEFTILCMDTSGCQARYNEKELAKILSVKSLDLYYRLRAAKELELAAIEGLESCPYCPWAVIIENPDERLFRCQNDKCLQVSCRGCKQAEHLPKTCEEAEAERKSNKRHAVEDAMSDALIRKCPKCAKPYVKDTGCNKIYCTGCRAYSCYVCQKQVQDYSHFDEGTGGFGAPAPARNGPKRCPLYDRHEAQHDNENIVAARDAAIVAQREAAAREGMQLEEGDLQVEAPALPPQLDQARMHPNHWYMPYQADRDPLRRHYEAQLGELAEFNEIYDDLMLGRVGRPPGPRNMPAHLIGQQPHQPAGRGVEQAQAPQPQGAGAQRAEAANQDLQQVVDRDRRLAALGRLRRAEVRGLGDELAALAHAPAFAAAADPNHPPRGQPMERVLHDALARVNAQREQLNRDIGLPPLRPIPRDAMHRRPPPARDVFGPIPADPPPPYALRRPQAAVDPALIQRLARRPAAPAPAPPPAPVPLRPRQAPAVRIAGPPAAGLRHVHGRQ